MANIASAKKRARQQELRRKQNAGQRSMLRKEIKKIVTAIQGKDKDTATAAYQAAVPIIDRMADKGLIHKNKAARHKSRLNSQIRAL
ncbi:MAG: 30S ribosomal protein S20 [Gammaproteobacteria bacterium]|nr:30S ribosomal protein S20 [Gammaproteobacteria bacterium]